MVLSVELFVGGDLLWSVLLLGEVVFSSLVSVSLGLVFSVCVSLVSDSASLGLASV